MVMKLFINRRMENLNKGIWSNEEDQKLIAYIKQYGIWNWSHMPKAAGLSRSGKSCRLRWMNYLRPSLKQECYNTDEIKTIIEVHKLHGNKWSKIAEKLPGRTDNGIKNFFNTHLKSHCSSKNGQANDANHCGDDPKRVKNYNQKKSLRKHTSLINGAIEIIELKYTSSESALPGFPTPQSFSSSVESYISSERNNTMESSSCTKSETQFQFQGNVLVEHFLVEDVTENLKNFVEHVEWGFQEHQSVNVPGYIFDSFNDDLNSRFWLNDFEEAQEVDEYVLW